MIYLMPKKKGRKITISYWLGTKHNLFISPKRLQNGFPISADQLRQVFKLPQSVAVESYVKAFQYKVLNSILYKKFWNDFQHQVTLQNVLLGIINVTTCTSPLLRLLNYFIIIGKLFLWDCRRNQILPKIEGFRHKTTSKYETKKPISKKGFVNKKWVLIPLLFELNLMLCAQTWPSWPLSCESRRTEGHVSENLVECIFYL